jgi:hypothetical protein
MPVLRPLDGALAFEDARCSGDSAGLALGSGGDVSGGSGSGLGQRSRDRSAHLRRHAMHTRDGHCDLEG